MNQPAPSSSPPATVDATSSRPRLRVAYMGSPDFAVPPLRLLLARPDVEVVLVVSQPDKPAGRGQKLHVPPVKQVALEAGLPVAQPEKLRTPPFAEVLRPLGLDLAIVVAYGRILPPDVLAVPRLGCWNVHGSLLPKYRGAAPIQRAVLDGEPETGVTLMQMEAGLDTGPMLRVRAVAIEDSDTAGSLFERLAPVGAAVLADGLDALAAGTPLAPAAQDDARATLAPMLDKSEGRIDWSLPARRVRDHVRGMDPWPGAFALLDGQPLKLWGARLAPEAALAGPAGSPPAPGTIVGLDGGQLVVACGQGAVTLAEGQLPGRKRMPLSAMVAGRALGPGVVLS